MRTISKLLIIFAATMFIMVGCGQKGDLFLPDETSEPEKTEESS